MLWMEDSNAILIKKNLEIKIKTPYMNLCFTEILLTIKS